jgi:hypothetical protein
VEVSSDEEEEDHGNPTASPVTSSPTAPLRRSNRKRKATQPSPPVAAHLKKKKKKAPHPKAASPRRSPRKRGAAKPSTPGDNAVRKRGPRPPPSKRETPSDGNDDIKALLATMVKQQGDLLQIMHTNNHAAESDAASAPAKRTASRTVVTPAIAAHPNFQSQEGPHRHSMHYFIENNMEMARLIEENAQLKRERLIRDLENSYERE